MRSRLCLVLVSAALLSACALRPNYRQILPPDVSRLQAGDARGHEDATLRVVDPQTRRPLAGVKVVLGTSRGRSGGTSDADGLVRLPVTPELLSENPLVEVILPAGAQGYAFEPVKAD